MFDLEVSYQFWIALLCVNVLFFLPPYIANFKNEPNPFGVLAKKRTLRSYLLLPYVKSSSDPFKINFEYTVAIILASLLSVSYAPVIHFCALVGLFTFVSIVYYSVMVYVFQKPPFLKGDIAFAKVGISILGRYRIVILMAIAVSLVGLYYLILLVTQVILELPANPALQIGAILTLCVLGLYKVRTSGYRLFHNRTVLSSLGYLYRNLEYSNRYHFLTEKGASYFDQHNTYKDIHLATKPDVHILCIESYGSLFFRSEMIASDKLTMMRRYESDLLDSGYHVVTGYSEPPQFAGGSWKSYSSLNFGIKLLDDGLYFTLFNNAQGFDHYQSLQGYLRSQGYFNYALAALQPNKGEVVDWDHIRRSFDSDKIIDWDTIGYKGKTIKFFSVRDIAPDQYALNKASDYILSEDNQPYSLFNINLNSHYPFDSPESLVKDWRTLQEIAPKMIAKDLPVEERYGKSIKYQLDNTVELIKESADRDGVYVVFGDHQPPFITDQRYGFETPIHIVSKRPELLEPFLKIGFQEGMYPPAQDEGSQMKHEGFFSLFMQGLNKAYGMQPERDLPYKPGGVIFTQ